jgi:hypothetical protein
MNDALWGVVVGGIVGSVTPLVTLFFGDRKWKREAKLAYLKSERLRLEAFYERTYGELGESIAVGTFPLRVIADMYIMMPPEVTKLYDEFMHTKERSDLDRQSALLEIATEMRKDLAARDTAILKMFS